MRWGCVGHSAQTTHSLYASAECWLLLALTAFPAADDFTNRCLTKKFFIFLKLTSGSKKNRNSYKLQQQYDNAGIQLLINNGAKHTRTLNYITCDVQF